MAESFKARLEGLFPEVPTPFRRQNGGRYDTQQVLKPGLGLGVAGTRIHLLQPGEPEQEALGVTAPRW